MITRLTVTAAVVLTAVLTGAPAQAGIGRDTMLRSWATGVCVDSNYAGQAYTLGCNGGSYQSWFPGGAGWNACGHYGCGYVVGFRSNETNRVLDSNASGAVYTTNYQSNNRYQEWLMTGNDNVTQLQNAATGLCLQTNGHGELFTTSCGSNFQDWKQGF